MDREIKTDTKKRPKLVWVIAIWYIVGLVFNIYSIYAINSGLIELTELEKANLDAFSNIEWGFSIIGGLLTTIASITLFLLKKITIKVWIAVIVFNIISYTYSLVITKHFNQPLTAVVIIAIVSAIYFYAKRLDTRGYLS